MNHSLPSRLALGSCLLIALTLLSALPALAATRPKAVTPAWTTFHGDNARTGVDPGSATFASVSKAWDSPALDGKIYAEPLLLGGTLYAATENNTVYAIDAAGGTVTWSKHLGTPVNGSALPCGNISPSGITGTPVIDPATNILYAVGFISPGQHTLFALDLNNLGNVLWSRGVDGPSPFSPTTQQQRSALSLASGMVYVPYGGLAGDCGTYHGYVVGAKADNSAAPISYVDQTGSQNEAGFWAASGAAVDGSGSLYVASGNGASTTTFDHGNSVIRLTPALAEADHWAPTDWAALNASDTDIGSLGPALVGSGLVFQSGKDGNGYLLQASSLGGTGVAAAFSAPICNSVFGGTAYLDPYIYVPCSNGLYALSLSGTSFSTSWSHAMSAAPPIIAGGAVWTVDYGSGTLIALDATTGNVRFSTSVGSVTHFTSPTAGGGRVFIGVNSSTALAQPHVTGFTLVPTAPGAYTATVPNRILDTHTSGGPIGARSSRNLTVRGGSTGVPANATAVVMNVTTTETTADSFLAVYPAGGTRPLVSNLNWVAGETRPNLVEVPVGSGSQVTFYNNDGATQVLVDLEGYYAPPSGTAGLLRPLAPSRLLDTRTSNGGHQAKFGPGETVNLQVTNRGNVPATGASAVVMNFTVTNPDTPSFLTVWPPGSARPTASNLNFGPSDTVPNRVIVGLGASGQVSVYNNAGSTDVVADVNAWVTDATAPASSAGLYTALFPVRILDTRARPPSVGPAGTLTLTIGGMDGVPSGATAVVLNVTVTNPTADSFITAWPSDQARPLASDLNCVPGQTIPNLVVVKLSPSGQVSFYNSAGNSDLVVDLFGSYS